MALPEFTRKKVEQLLATFCEQRVPPRIRAQLRLAYRFRGDSVTLFEERPRWNQPEEWTSMPVAQFRFEPPKGEWRLYCADRNSRWHAYQGMGATKDFSVLLAAVGEDPTGIFWG